MQGTGERAMKRLLLLIAVAVLTGVSCATAATTKNGTPSPVLIELFTSEGCSDCPPAEKFVQYLDQAQPIPEAQLIVLSEHITYFNHANWIDPYSSQQLTDRQYAYTHVLGLTEVFTPQMLVDGKQELWGKSSQQVEDVLHRAAADPSVPVQIDSVSLDPKASILRTHIAVDGTSARHNADIYAAVALDHATSNVLGGENRGKSLDHVAVVEALDKVGKLKKGKPFNGDVAIKLNPKFPAENLRLVVFVQESGVGKIDGAALRKGIRGNANP
jgi:hypothetical protein